MNDVTRILSAIEQGDAGAASQLLPLVYDELRKLAAKKLALEQPGQTLQATALVHEAYLRLVGDGDARHWDRRGNLFAAAATAMRRILIERARQKRRQIHGDGGQRQELRPDLVASPEPDEDLLALDAALARLAERDPLKARLVELHYFAGISGEKAAKILGISDSSLQAFGNGRPSPQPSPGGRGSQKQLIGGWGVGALGLLSGVRRRRVRRRRSRRLGSRRPFRRYSRPGSRPLRRIHRPSACRRD